MVNHLATETSPYLLQHVNNPVNWYPWCDAALERSRKLDRPIFLSIGYSACHWCHVMEHESFENEDIARLMNDWFVCIKVDREERPDLDQIYMSAVQAMTGSGGWPMSVFLTPERKPFFGGTYWPPSARWGRPGFREILAGVHEAWQNRRPAVDAQADELTLHVKEAATPPLNPKELNETMLQRAMSAIIGSADRVHGGFGSAPKFPHPMDLRLAMRCWKRFHSDSTAQAKATDVLDVVTLTLDKMARGGIYDHLGGGFARYSTDERWLVPHFEKMLYDNAQLVPAYLEAYQITGRLHFARVARETLEYNLREMTQPQGGFYSTQDADSEGVEGKFFVWSEAEVNAILAEESLNSSANAPSGDSDNRNDKRSRLAVFKDFYDVTLRGNWEHSNILNCPKSMDEAAKAMAIDVEDLEQILAWGRQKLFDVRSKRIWPGRDDKVLVSWNGLMIGAMAMAANVLNEPRFVDAARAAADFILTEMVEREPLNGSSRSNDSAEKTTDSHATSEAPIHEIGSSLRIFHSYKDGRARFNAYLDDYASLIDGLCELYQAVFDARYLDAALGLAERMIDQFWDATSKGFFYTSSDHETLIARNKETQDNATPSGNSLAVMGLLKLARLTGRMDLEEKAVLTLEMMSGQLDRNPLSAGLSLMALDFLLGPTHEIVLAQGKQGVSEVSSKEGVTNLNDGRKFIANLSRRFVPNKVLHDRPWQVSDNQLPSATRTILTGKTPQRESMTAYVCHQGTCEPPITGDQELKELIESL